MKKYKYCLNYIKYEKNFVLFSPAIVFDVEWQSKIIVTAMNGETKSILYGKTEKMLYNVITKNCQYLMKHLVYGDDVKLSKNAQKVKQVLLKKIQIIDQKPNILQAEIKKDYMEAF